MSFKTFIVKKAAAFTAKQINKWKKTAIKDQQSTMLNLVNLAQQTVFGKDHHFSTIKTYEDFKKSIPVRDYEDLRPYIDRVTAGEDSRPRAEREDRRDRHRGIDDCARRAAPAARRGAGMSALVKARLAEIGSGERPTETPNTSVDVQFNPTTLRVQISNRTAGGTQAGAQARQRPGTGEMQVSFDLIFDTADEVPGMDSFCPI